MEGGAIDDINCCGSRRPISYYLMLGCLWKEDYDFQEICVAIFNLEKKDSDDAKNQYFEKFSRE